MFLQRVAAQEEEQASDDVALVAKPLVPHGPDRCLPHEHVTFVREDYRSHLIRHDYEKNSFFAGMGLKPVSGPRFTARSGMQALPLAKRIATLSSGALPFSCRMVFALVNHSGKTICDMAAHLLEKERSLTHSILWPDAKFRKRVAEIGSVPSSDAEFADLSWTTKRKRLHEIEKKRKAKQDFIAEELALKRRKLLSRLKEYPEKELRSMFPKLNQKVVVPVIETFEPYECGSCQKTVFEVDGHVYHKCSVVRQS